MLITAYAPMEVISLGDKGDNLLHSTIIRINNQLKEGDKEVDKVYQLGCSFLKSIKLAEKIPKEYKELSDVQKVTFFLLLRSEFAREGWRDLNLHTQDASGVECFAVTLQI